MGMSMPHRKSCVEPARAQPAADSPAVVAPCVSFPADVSGAPRTLEAPAPHAVPRESGGREGPDPTRFGDWEHNGRCIDF